MATNYTGYGANCTTIKIAASQNLVKGDLVNLNANGEVRKAGANETFIGVIADVKGNFATVQTQGFAELKLASSASVSCGAQKLVATASGVATDSSTTNVNYVRTVMYVDSSSNKLGVIL